MSPLQVSGNRGKLAKGIVGDNLVAERGAFIISSDRGREEIREVPFVYRPKSHCGNC